MLLANVVETSRFISQTSRRLEKIDLLAALLRQLAPEEIEIAVSFLSGQTLQGRIGIGYASAYQGDAPAAEAPSLTVMDVNSILETIATMEGPGSTRRRQELLHSMLA